MDQKRGICKWMDSPVGRLQLVATDEGLAAILWESDRPGRVRVRVEPRTPVTRSSSRPSVSSRNTSAAGGRNLP